MKMKWQFIVSSMLMSALLVGCGTSLEEQIETGFAQSEKVFNEGASKTNKKIDNVKVYLPDGFEIENSETENNYLIRDNDDLYVLFVNTLEDQSSQLYYNGLMDEQKEQVVEINTYEVEETFGFTAVLDHGKDEYELIASVGGVKVSTMTVDKKVDEKLTNMMQIANSVQFEQ